MDRKEAIYYLGKVEYMDANEKEAIDMAIEALSAERTGITTDMAAFLHEEIRCEALCTNPMKSDRGCDGGCQYDTELLKRIDEVIKKVIVDSTTERTGEWIPVSERLPDEEEKPYWVCTDTEYQCECRWTNVNPIWTQLTKEWHWNIFDTPQYSKVVAWMPLPEPYKGGDDE